MTPPRPIEGMRVLVTGAAHGIGAATARLLAQRGARLALLDLDGDGLERLAADLETGAAPPVVIRADVSRREDLVRARGRAIHRLGAVDAVVHCAGIVIPGAIERVSPDDVDRQIAVNVLGPINVTQLFLPHFRTRRRGHFVHVASMGGFVPMPSEATYAASKFAVRGFGLSLALELRGSGIAVSIVCPDSTDTAQLRAEAADEGSTMSFIDPPLRAEQVAAAIVATLRRPRLEVMVPRRRGLLVRLVAAEPRIQFLVFPILQWIGRRGRESYLRRLAGDATRPVALEVPA